MSVMMSHNQPIIKDVLAYLEDRYGIRAETVHKLSIDGGGAHPLFVTLTVLVPDVIGRHDEGQDAVSDG